jgi:hypothetical protein
MAVLLEQLAREADPMQIRFLSRERADAMGAAIQARTPASQNPEYRFRYAVELLNAGYIEPALREFEEIQALLQQPGANVSPLVRTNVQLHFALCHMRQAEQINCVSNHTSEACLLPIKGSGIHRWQDGSRQAIGTLTNLLSQFPESMEGRWLLNVAAMTVGDYPQAVPERWLIPPQVFASDYDIGRFIDVAPAAGLAANELSGGSVVDDFDGDGLLDVMVTSIGVRDQMRFYRNLGNGTFADRTRAAGLTGLTGGLNLLSADFNNDGHLDVLVLRGAWFETQGRFPNSLLRNNGNGTFEDVTVAAGVFSQHPTQTGVWFDYDGDGWLDLFIGNEHLPTGEPHPSELYRNLGNGTFTNVAAAAGLAVRAFVKGAASADYNNDGRPDLYVSVLGGPNRLFRNAGPAPGGAAWRFVECGGAAGVALPTHSFPTWFFDYDNDGWEDLFVAGYRINDVGDIAADYLGLPNNGIKARLYRNRGDGSFANVTEQVRLDRVLQAMGSNFGDLDNDGWLDFYLGTGNPDLATIVPNRMFRNAEGRLFQDVTTSGGFGHLQKGHGVSFADIDNDGDQDVFEDMGGAVTSDVYPNVLFLNPGHRNHWLKLQLAGLRANRGGIGARVAVTLATPGGMRVLHRTVGTGGSFGCNPLRLEIGLADATKIESVEIRWPGSGTVQRLAGLQIDRYYRVREGSEVAELLPLRSFQFTHASAPAAHDTHSKP